jgi:hypothetical protein
MLFLSRLFQTILLLLLVRFVLRGIAALARARRAPPAAPRPKSEAATELIRDRVCNTFLPRERALAAIVAGREEHFCSAGCRDKALAAVSRAS